MARRNNGSWPVETVCSSRKNGVGHDIIISGGDAAALDPLETIVVSESDDELIPIEYLDPNRPSTSSSILYRETSSEFVKGQLTPVIHNDMKKINMNQITKQKWSYDESKADESEKKEDGIERENPIIILDDDDDSDKAKEINSTYPQVLCESYEMLGNVNLAKGGSSRQFSPEYPSPKKRKVLDTDSIACQSNAIGFDTSDEEYSPGSQVPHWFNKTSRKQYIRKKPCCSTSLFNYRQSKLRCNTLPPSIDLDSSDYDKENYRENSAPLKNFIAMSMATDEVHNKKNNDSLMAQNWADLVFQSDKLKKELEMKRSIIKDEEEWKKTEEQDDSMKMSDDSEGEEVCFDQPVAKLDQMEINPMFKEGSFEIEPTYLQPTIGTANNKDPIGKRAQQTFEREQLLTVERLKDLHGSILSRPADDEKAEDPPGLTVPLMPHQKHALAWILWRETQKPRGGILADDMGLGKTLTMISLVMASIAERDSADERSENEEELPTCAPSQRPEGGTLVIAPASLVSQWESEVKKRCRRNLVTVELYHGTNREKMPQRLAKKDIVITTYNIVSQSPKHNGVLYKIRWRRVILDEAHIIRNHKKNTCESVCGIDAERRWALTGTPIQNKQMDLFAILKFLRCTPFDDVKVWKRWVDNKNSAGCERLATVLKSVMLRRTKLELLSKGSLPQSLPNKSIQIINFELDNEERLVYDKLMLYSATIFAQFLEQRAQKAQRFDFEFVRETFQRPPSWKLTGKNGLFNKAQLKLLFAHCGIGGDITAHHILVLLLRLRQVCCHPSLIHSMLNHDDLPELDLGNNENNLRYSLTNATNVSFHGNDGNWNDANEPDDEMGVDERVGENLLIAANPVFHPKRQSSKMRAVLAKLEEIAATDDKIIVVSQWTSVLDILAGELGTLKDVTFKMFTGKVPVKDRQEIVDDFNDSESETNVLLLSLTAGGVGLNLFGGNHMLLIDNHWNPQLECQAQDRIYRFGQLKDVYIYRYLCTDTVEERIKLLQDRKLEIAANVLEGGGTVISSKLTLEDMKTLFGL